MFPSSSQEKMSEEEIESPNPSRYLFLRSLSGNLFLVQDRERDNVECVRKKMQSKREGDILSRLDHVNIVKMLYTQGPHIYMEFVPDTDIIEWIETRFVHTIIPMKIIKCIAYQLMQVLIYLKEQRVVHRDIKPDNIMIDHKSHFIKVVDFGLACLETDTVKFGGTLRYMAPECISEHTFSFKSDLYSAAFTIYAIALQRIPLRSYSTEILTNLMMHAIFNYEMELKKAMHKIIKVRGSTEFRNWFKLCSLPNPSKRIDVQAASEHPFLAC